MARLAFGRCPDPAQPSSFLGSRLNNKFNKNNGLIEWLSGAAGWHAICVAVSMAHENMTIRWRNKPLDMLSPEETRRALVDVLEHAIVRPADATPLQPFYATFICGMLVGAVFCLAAVALASL